MVAVIHHAIKEVESWAEVGLELISQTAKQHRAISLATVDSKLVWDYVNLLNEVDSQMKLTVRFALLSGPPITIQCRDTEQVLGIGSRSAGQRQTRVPRASLCNYCSKYSD